MPSSPILLVEDNADDELLTIRAFKNAHIANPVVVARDGVEALEMLFGEGAHAGKMIHPHIVLLDMKLPKVDGLAVLKRLRTDPRTRFMPVVVLTSSNEERDLVESYALGANSFIRKPVDFQQFTEAVHTLGLYWVVHNLPPPQHKG
jgi:two-component system, response regulator